MNTLSGRTPPRVLRKKRQCEGEVVEEVELRIDLSKPRTLGKLMMLSRIKQNKKLAINCVFNGSMGNYRT